MTSDESLLYMSWHCPRPVRVAVLSSDESLLYGAPYPLCLWVVLILGILLEAMGFQNGAPVNYFHQMVASEIIHSRYKPTQASLIRFPSNLNKLLPYPFPPKPKCKFCFLTPLTQRAMEALFTSLSYYIHGKPIWNPLRKVMDLLLSFNIAFLIWDFGYGPIRWEQYDEYGEILNFLLKGGFVIPACILVLSQSTIFLSGLIFYGLSHRLRSNIIKRYAKRLRLKDRSMDHDSSKIIDVLNKWSKIRSERRFMIDLFHKVKKADLEKINQKGQEAIANIVELKGYFHFLWKLLIASCLFSQIIPDFSGMLFILTTSFAFMGMGICLMLIALQEQIPIMVRNFAAEAEQYLMEKEKEALDNYKNG